MSRSFVRQCTKCQTIHYRANSDFLSKLTSLFTSCQRRFSRSVLDQSKWKLPFQGSSHESTKETVTSKANSSSLIGRDFLSLRDFEKEDIHQFLWTAKDLKIRMKDGGEPCPLLQGKAALMYFNKDDLATRISVENGMAKLGGHAMYHKSESTDDIKQAGWLISAMSDVIVMTSDQQKILQMADESHVPVVSGMTDVLNPLQVLSYFMTIQEFFGFLRGAKIAYVGEGGPTLNSLLYGCAKLGIELHTATPQGCEPDIDVMLDAINISNKMGGFFKLGDDPLKAVYRADVIITDCKTKSETVDKYRINRKMLREAGGTWIFLHSLDQRSGDIAEVDADILYGEESMVKVAMENRLWTMMSVMLHLQLPYEPIINKPKYVRG